MGGAPAGYDVLVRDVNNAPVAGAVVTLDFSASGMRVYSTQNAGTTLNCAANAISRTTDALGRVNFGPRVSGFANWERLFGRQNYSNSKFTVGLRFEF